MKRMPATAFRQGGFTLIEMMIVVALIAIIAAIAYPAYTEQVLRSRRADGRAGLMGTAQELERCFTQYNAYNDTSCPVVGAGPAISQPSPEGYYTITDSTLTATTFDLTATPTSVGGQDRDTVCTTLTLDHTGQTGSTGARAANSECWR